MIDEDDRDRDARVDRARRGGEVLTRRRRDRGRADPADGDRATRARTRRSRARRSSGPSARVTPYDSLDEAIELANGTRYGLQAGIFTATSRRALDAAQRLEFGGVTVNEAPTFRADQMPYGGVKDSGNTREGPPTRSAR